MRTIVAARMRYSIEERKRILSDLWDKAEKLGLNPTGTRGSSFGFWITGQPTDEFKDHISEVGYLQN